MKPQESVSDVSPLTREEEQAEVIRRLEEDIIFGRFAPGSRKENLKPYAYKRSELRDGVMACLLHNEPTS